MNNSKKSKTKWICVCVYVDNLYIAQPRHKADKLEKADIDEFYKLSERFDTVALSEVDIFVGMEVSFYY